MLRRCGLRSHFRRLLIANRLRVARLYTVWLSIAFLSAFSRFIQGKFGNFKSFSSIFSKALSRNITSCDNATSVINVVFFLPIVPHPIKTIGRSLMNPRFFISLWLSTAKPIFLRILSKIISAITHPTYHGMKLNGVHKSIKSLYTCL